MGDEIYKILDLNLTGTYETKQKCVEEILHLFSNSSLFSMTKILEDCASNAWDAALDTYDRKSYSFSDWWKEHNNAFKG